MTPNRHAIDVGIVVGDIETSMAFYRDVLGLDLRSDFTLEFGTVYRLHFGESVVKLLDLHVKPPRPPGGAFTEGLGLRYITFPVTDIHAVFARCAASGAAVDLEPVERLPGLWAALVRDPDGNSIEFTQLTAQ